MKKLVWRASGLMSLAFFSMQASLFAQAPAPATAVNTIYDEQHPVQAPDGQLYFTIGYHPNNKGGATDPGDVYRSGGLEQAAEMVGDLSTQGLDVLVGFPDAQTAYVYHARGPLGQGVHRYLKSGSNWNLVGMLKMGNFRNNSNHFSGRLLADGKTILMAMNSFGSFGNDDLYVSTQMEGDNWTSPVNLGPVVNTFAEEQSPFYDEKNGILYFSSNQADSRGGKEVFYAVRQGEDWTSWSRPKPFEIPGRFGRQTGFMLLNTEDFSGIVVQTSNSNAFGDFYTFRLGTDRAEALVAEAAAIRRGAPVQQADATTRVSEEQESTGSRAEAEARRRQEVLTRGQNQSVQEAASTSRERESLAAAAQQEQELRTQAAAVEEARKREAEQLARREEAERVARAERAAQAEAAREAEAARAAEALRNQASTSTPSTESATAATGKAESGFKNAVGEQIQPVRVTVVAHDTEEALNHSLIFSNERGVRKEISGQSAYMQTRAERMDWKTIAVRASGYVPQYFAVEEWVALDGQQVSLLPARVGTSLVLSKINFNRGTADFADATSIEVLDELVRLLQEDKSLKVRLEGHTDNVGDPGLNKELSLQRASKIRGYLTLNGVAFERVRIAGFGGTRPVENAATEEARERNRRVEMYLIQ